MLANGTSMPEFLGTPLQRRLVALQAEITEVPEEALCGAEDLKTFLDASLPATDGVPSITTGEALFMTSLAVWVAEELREDRMKRLTGIDTK